MATGGLHICVLSTSFQKNDMGWPQQPLQEEYQISVKNWIFDDLFHKKGLVLVIWVLGPGARDDQSIKICIFWWNEAVEVIEAIEAVEATEVIEAAEVLRP